MLTVFIAIAWDRMYIINEQKRRAEVQAVVNKIAATAKEIYYQGDGARRTIIVTFPEGVDDSSPQIINSTIALKYKGSDIFSIVDFPVQGTLPNRSGTYELELIFSAGGVLIGAPPFIMTPASLRFVTCASNTTQTILQNLTLKNSRNATTEVLLFVAWDAVGINVTVSNTSITLEVGESKNVTVNVTIGPNIVGTFSGKISASSGNYSTSVSTVVVSKACVVPQISYLLIRTYKNPGYALQTDNFTLPPNVTITTGNWSANAWITIRIFDPNTQIVYHNTTQTNTTGGHSFIWRAVWPLGVYTVVVNDSVTTTNTTFSLVSCT